MRKHLNLISSLFILTALLILPYFVFAQTTNDDSMLGKLQLVAGKGGYVTEGGPTLPMVVGNIIQGVLGLLGAIFIIILVIADIPG
jgi:hypothetical protein